MEQTDLFNSNKEISNLKRKIYERYCINFNTIKSTMHQALVHIYGQQHSEIIKKKLNQIYLANFFEKIDIMDYFEIDYSKTFPPTIDTSDDEYLYDKTSETSENLSNLLDNLDNLLNEVDELHNNFFIQYPELEKYVDNTPDEAQVIEKINDDDINLYYAFASNYSFCLYREYQKKFHDFPSSSERFDEYALEESENLSMYSCMQEDLKKLNLLLKIRLPFEKLYKNLKSKKTFLIDNVTDNFEAAHIIFINPLQLSKECIFSLINKIVLSVNISVSTLDNYTFSFDNGLNDIYTKSFSEPPITYDYYKHELLTRSIAENITFEILEYLNSNNLDLYGYKNFTKPKYYFDEYSYYTDFYKSYRELILESIITHNNKILFDKIGEKNFMEFVNESFDYYEELQNGYSSNSDIFNDASFKHFKKFIKSLENMKNYNN